MSLRTLVFSYLFIVVLGTDVVNTANCNYEPLPDSFDSLSYLKFNNEFHLQGEFLANFTAYYNLINFTISEDSLIRAYVAPHDADVDIWLYNFTSGSAEVVAHSSLAIGSEEAISLTLPRGQYSLKLNYFGYLFGIFTPSNCDTMTMEVAISPLSRVQTQIGNFQCPQSDSFPIIDSDLLYDVESFNFVNNETYIALNTNDTEVRWLASYNFTLSEIKGKANTWSVEAGVGIDFLTGGSLGVLILDSNQDSVSLDCTEDYNCTKSSISRMNENVVRTTLGPGTYSLWIYDDVEYRNKNLSSCVPFSFFWTIEAMEIPETFVSCEAPELPATLIPGFFSTPEGYLHIADDFLLDLDVGEHKLSFYVRANSYFRVVAAPHRVDIDLRLVNTDTGMLVAYALKFGSQEEAIVTFLEPGNYNLSIKFYGFYEKQFCETFYLEVGLAAEFLYPDGALCSGTSDVAPDLSAMNAQLASANGTFVLPSASYLHVYAVDDDDNIDFTQHQFFAQNFTLLQESVVHAHIGFNFLLGPAEVYITSSEGTYYATYSRDQSMLHSVLPPGSYSLVLSTGPIQSLYSEEALDNYPTCLEYNFDMQIYPTSVASACLEYKRVPTTLNVPEYLGRASIVHFDSDFLIPLAPGQFTLTEKMTFTVAENSFFRVWTEPHHVDIDLRLRENGTLVKTTWSWGNEESIVYRLSAGASYTFEIVYFHWAHTDPHYVDPTCFLYHMELAITPLTDDTPYVCSEYLPETGLIPDADGTTAWLLYDEEFYFTQASTAVSAPIVFLVTGPVYFRAEIRYDFLWSDLTLVIKSGDSVLSYGNSGYDRDGFTTMLLPPGNYTLEVHEPAPQSYTDLRRCISFWLTVGYEPVGSNTVIGDFSGCQYDYLSSSLNIVPYLSDITQQRFHDQRNILVNVADKMDTSVFTLAETSVFSIYVPVHSSVDVDMYLRNATNGARIDRSNGIRDESITHILPAGSYSLEFRYYGLYGVQLPSPSDCAYFPMELSIVPMSYLASITQPDINDACTTTYPPSTMQIDTSFSGTFQRTMGTTFTPTMSFSVDTPVIFHFDLRYDFVTSGLVLSLAGSVQEPEGPVNTTIYALYGENHAFFHRVLLPGAYTVQIKDAFPSRVNSSVQCGFYSINYLINTTDVPEVCDDTEQLPEDLFSDASVPYGGPQEADGSVRIWGDEFALISDGPKDRFIEFNVPEDAYMRAFVSSLDENDIDFFLYNNVNRTSGSLVGSSFGTSSVESAIFFMKNQTSPYLLDLFFFDIVSDPDTCPTFHFEMAIKTVSTLQAEVVCPSPLPVPEVPNPSIFVSSEVIWVDDEYIFTSDRIAGNTNAWGEFVYRLTITSPTNMTIFSSIGYDFLANDYKLSISDSANGQQVYANGYYDGTDDRSDYINFENYLFAELPAGVYYLDIIEKDADLKDFQLDEYCHRFEFFLAVFPSDDWVSTPTIDTVRPAGGSSLNPGQDLAIEITFSEPIKQLSPNPLSFLTSTKAVYLSDTSVPGSQYLPASAHLDGERRALGVVFSKSNFAVNKNFSLSINASAFQTAAGDPFTLLEDIPHVYSFTTCQCSEHGTCNNQNQCVCETGYAGVDCSACAAGYHFAGDECVLNTKCNATVCNGHGQCVENQGSPLCYCYTGYATTGDSYCSVCALGYTGYPNCTLKDQSAQRSDSCTAPLLPVNLDSIGYLGYNGAIHLRGDYFVDYENFQHNMYFSLSQDSVVRLYTEPHKVDIDIWLYSVGTDGKLTYIDAGVTFGHEEIIYKTLPGTAGDHPNEYLIRFRYFTWGDNTLSSCETANIELEITPSDIASEIAGQMSTDCSTKNVFPQIPGYDNISYALVTGSNFTYTPNTIFNVASRPGAVAAPYFFSNINFAVKSTEGKMAYLQVEVGYRFVLGDLALLLESGNNSDHCGPKADKDYCFTGSNFLNRNKLSRFIPDGNYSLWIYEPEPQNANITSCSTFTFTFSIVYRDMLEDIFYCQQQLLPESLNAVGFITEDNYLHIADNFLMVNDTYVQFTVQVASYMRVYGRADSITAFTLYRMSPSGNLVEVASTNYGVQAELYYALSKGTYSLLIETFFADSRCPVIALEWSIVPTAQLPSSCIGYEVLPSMSNIHVPYSLPKATFYSYLNSHVIRQWTFTVDELALLEVVLDSDFMTSALKVALIYTDTSGSNVYTTTTYGDHTFNRNYLKQSLEPGNYTLQIVTSNDPNPRPQNFPTCAKFEFGFTLVSSSAASSCSFTGEAIPANFNTIRYLGDSGRFDYQSSIWRVPDFNSFTYKSIYFNVTKTSVFRAYTEPHEIDIDIGLYQVGVIGSLVDGGYTINNEESIVYILQPNVTYYLELLFWKWGTYTGPACPVFNMEVAIVPDVELPANCPGGSDHWPAALKGDIQLPFYYNNRDTNETLYFQQRFNETRTYSLSFVLPQMSKLYALLKYDFPTGDIVMRLDNVDTQVSYYASNALSGDILQVTGLLGGNYQLVFYELAGYVQDHMGCSPFDFEITIEADSPGFAEDYDRLPSDLNALPFLKYTNEVHIQDNFLMFEENDIEYTYFNLTEASLVRVTATHILTNNLEVGLTIVPLNVKTNKVTAFTSLFYEAQPGAYQLQVIKETATYEPYVINFELAIDSIANIKSAITYGGLDTMCSSTTPFASIIPSPSGDYSYRNHQLFLSETAMRTQKTYVTAPMVLDQASVVYAKASFNFLLSDMQISISGTTTLGETISIMGYNGRNLNELNQLLPAGRYEFVITSRAYWTVQMLTLLPHCTEYSLRVSIQNADEAEHVDCADYNTLPWDLNSPNGGSKPFGGPLDGSGSLHISGQFMMPSTSGTDIIQLAINRDSLLSITNRESYFGQVSYRVQTGTTMKLIITPTMSSSFTDQRGELFLLKHNGQVGVGSTVYEIELIYSTSTTVPCPSFGLDIAVKPVDSVGKLLLCSSSQTSVLPSTSVVLGGDGTYSEYVEGVLADSDVFNNGNSSTGYSIEIPFTVNKTSLVSASIEYNSLASGLQLEILIASRRTRVSYGVYQIESYTTYGQSNINLLLSGSLLPNSYILHIYQPATKHLPFVTGTGKASCYPFTYSLQIVPKVGVSYVQTVSPNTADNLNPSKTLLIELTFSTTIYNNNKIVNHTNLAPFKSAFYIVNDDSGIIVNATTAEESNGVFTLLFSSLSSGSSFTLKIRSNVLYDSASNAIKLLSVNKYKTIDTTCSGQGTFDSGYCFCNSGYAGVECTICDIGYENVNKNASQAPICKQKTGKLCFIDSCGCDPKFTTSCVPNGYCNDTSGAIVCQCYSPWAGATCQQCAEGYHNTSSGCAANAKCPTCARGYCDEAIGQCICPEHFTGKTCDECASGWSGDDCSQKVDSNPSTNYNDAKWLIVLNGLKIFSIIIAVLVIVTTVVFLVWKNFARKQPSNYNAVFEAMDLEETHHDVAPKESTAISLDE